VRFLSHFSSFSLQFNGHDMDLPARQRLGVGAVAWVELDLAREVIVDRRSPAGVVAVTAPSSV